MVTIKQNPRADTKKIQRKHTPPWKIINSKKTKAGEKGRNHTPQKQEDGTSKSLPISIVTLDVSTLNCLIPRHMMPGFFWGFFFFKAPIT